MSARDDRRASARARRILDRVAALRRSALPDTVDAAREPEPDELRGDALVQDLRHRLDALEQAFEGLQDAMYRESRRRDEEIAELRRRIEPEAIARSLSDDARKRGL